MAPGAGRSDLAESRSVRECVRPLPLAPFSSVPDRKSTRLNSSHQIISYAVFCLKKKKDHEITADSTLGRVNWQRYSPPARDSSRSFLKHHTASFEKTPTAPALAFVRSDTTTKAK